MFHIDSSVFDCSISFLTQSTHYIKTKRHHKLSVVRANSKQYNLRFSYCLRLDIMDIMLVVVENHSAAKLNVFALLQKRSKKHIKSVPFFIYIEWESCAISLFSMMSALLRIVNSLSVWISYEMNAWFQEYKHFYTSSRHFLFLMHIPDECFTLVWRWNESTSSFVVFWRHE